MSSLSVCVSEEVFISPSPLKDTFAGCRILGWWVFSLSTLWTNFTPLLSRLHGFWPYVLCDSPPCSTAPGLPYFSPPPPLSPFPQAAAFKIFFFVFGFLPAFIYLFTYLLTYLFINNYEMPKCRFGSVFLPFAVFWASWICSLESVINFGNFWPIFLQIFFSLSSPDIPIPINIFQNCPIPLGCSVLFCVHGGGFLVLVFCFFFLILISLCISVWGVSFDISWCSRILSFALRHPLMISSSKALLFLLQCFYF